MSTINLYSYPASISNKETARIFNSQVKKDYLKRSLILILALPIDLIYLVIFYLFKRKNFELIIATEKFYEYQNYASKELKALKITTPNFLFMQNTQAQYFPASIIYLIASIGLYLPANIQKSYSQSVVYLLSKLLRSALDDINFISLLVHSDALPFARSIVFACKKLGIKTVCIQHGNFHQNIAPREIDGIHCDLNILRSKEDKCIFQSIALETPCIIHHEFFCLNVKFSKTRDYVLLLGEGHHITDPILNNLYLSKLKLIHDALLKANLRVKFKPHPSEYNLKFPQFKEISKSSTEVCLANVFAVIGFTSSLLYESAQIGINTYSILINNYEHIYLQSRNELEILPYNGVSTILRAAEGPIKSKSIDHINEYKKFNKILMQ